MRAWDRYGPQLKRFALDVSFVSSVWILGFVFAIAKAPCDFLYLNIEYMILKNKNKKQKKSPLSLFHLSHPLDL